MLHPDRPFILLDDARPSDAAPARLYRDPIHILSAARADELPGLFDGVRRARANGYHAAGYLGYAAGQPLNKFDMESPSEDGDTLAWFGIFNNYQSIKPEKVAALLPPACGAYLSPLRAGIDPAAYKRAFERVQEFIRAGDIYQANLTFRAAAAYAGNPLALYAAIRLGASAGYGGVIWTGSEWHLSFSPELFFAVKDRRVTTRPMKGTAVRHSDNLRDRQIAAELQSDPKQRAENLMIVDLLRNDLSRVCRPGSVKVPDLFHVENYPTVHQMTSTVTGLLDQGKDALDLIQTIFPCGSITGAPKIRAMEIIDAIENSPRGLYCGSIGRIDANGDAAFNVAIRTFSLNEETKRLSLGLGSGVVADSKLAGEWAECLAKGGFAKMPGYGFDLIETMRFEPAQGVLRLERHLERMKASALALDFEFDRHAVRNQLHAVTFRLEKSSKIRVLLSRTGAIGIEIRDAPPLSDPLDSVWTIALAPLPVAPDDFRLSHKTSDRGFYDDARIAAKAACGADEVLFIRADGYVTEGSFTTIFVERGGKLLTPPHSRGLLPGILRQDYLETGQAIEADLRQEDLTSGFFVGNSLRGLIPAKLVRKAVA